MRALLLAALSLFFASASAFASSDLSVPYANAYATSPAQKNGAVFLRIVNKAAQDDAIIAATSTVAEKIELHTHIEENNVIKMRAVDQIAVPQNGAAVLFPMGDHIMLIGLKVPLEAGTSFPLTLKLKSGTEKLVTVSVVKPGSLASGDMKDCPMHGDQKEQTKSDAHSHH